MTGAVVLRMSKRVFRGLVAIAVCSGLVSCSTVDDGEGFIAPQQVVVDEKSAFSFAENGIEIIGQPGVAVPGTPVAISTRTEPGYGNHDFLQFTGTSVEIVLGDNLQPDADIRVTVPVPSASSDDEQVFLAVSENNGELEPLPVEYDRQNGTVTATLSHLSFVDFFRLDLGKLVARTADALGTLFSGQFGPAPDCLDEPITVGEVTYQASRAKTPDGRDLNSVWPCLRTNDGKILLDLQANGTQAWFARTRPDVGIGASSPPGSIAATAAGFNSTLLAISSRHHSTGVLSPGATLTFAFDATNPPTVAEVQADPGPLLTAAAIYMAGSVLDLFGANTAGALEKAPGVYDCVASGLNTGAVDDSDRVGQFTSATMTALECMSVLAEGPLAFMLGVITDGIGIIAGTVSGAAFELIDKNHGIIEITRSGDAKGQSGDDTVSTTPTTPPGSNSYLLARPTKANNGSGRKLEDGLFQISKATGKVDINFDWELRRPHTSDCTVETVVTGNGYRQEHTIGPGNRCSGDFSVSGLRNTITSPGTYSYQFTLVDQETGEKYFADGEFTVMAAS